MLLLGKAICVVCGDHASGDKTCGASACVHVYICAVMKKDVCLCDMCESIGTERMVNIKESCAARRKPFRGPQRRGRA